MSSMICAYHRPRIFKHLRPFVLICSMSVLSLTPVPSHADWRDAIGAAAGSLSEGFSRQAEADRQLEEQKKLLEYQYKLEREKREREYQLENERREQARVEQESRRIAAEEKKKRDEEDAKRRALNTGTGFVIAPGGYLVTNNHVIEDKTDYAVRDYKGRFYKATVIARDSDRDLVLLKVGGAFPSLRVASSESVSKGQHVLAVGYPQIAIQGNESKVTDGIISSFSGIKNDDNWFQISVPIQGGNSGGPLVTESGVVIGVVAATANVARYYKMTGNLPQNVNYAIKSKVLLDFLKFNNVQNVATSKGKTSIDAVDASTMLVIAKNGPIDVSYTVSPEQLARDERERARLSAEEANRRRAAEAEEKKQMAMAAALDAKHQKEQLMLEKKLQAEELVARNKRLNEERIALKQQQDEAKRIELRNSDIQKAFPNYQEIRSDEVFLFWLGQQSDDTLQKLDSPKSRDVIAALKRYQAELPTFTEQYLQQLGTWIADANGCKFLDPKPEPNESITWDGQCEQGRGAGKGELNWFSNGVAIQKSIGMYKDGMLNGIGKTETFGKGYVEGNFRNSKLEGHGKKVGIGDNAWEYEGNFSAGKPNGIGKVVIKNGGSYEGSQKDGKFHGQGKQIFKDGSTYEGEFRDGKFGGNGKLTSPTGDIWEGAYKQGKLEGQGKVVWKEGASYEGAFKDGKFHGQGKRIYKDGGSYEGEFRDGKSVGNGKLKYPNGNIYEGEFRDNLPEGQGKITWTDGSVVEGEFREGKLDGKGKGTYANGSSYVGLFKNNIPNGYGKWVLKDGRFYEGNSKEGKFDGQGIMGTAGGDRRSVEFADGVRVNK